MNPKRQKVRKFLIVTFFLLLPITLNYYSPALMTQGTASRVATFSLFTWTAIFVSSLLLGRAFCGYACPFNGLQTAWETVSDKPNKQVRFVRWIKYAMWGLWAGAVVAFAVATGGWQRIDLLYMTPNVISMEALPNHIVYYTLVGITLLPTLMGKRGFCHYFCPFGVWGIAGTRIGRMARLPMLHLRGDATACTDCGKCDRNCPMSLPVSAMAKKGDAFHTECTLCGTCVDGCKNGGIRYAFGIPARSACCSGQSKPGPASNTGLPARTRGRRVAA